MDGHHFGVHGERDVGMVAAAGAFEGDECLTGGLLLRGLLFLRLVPLLLQLLLQVGHRRSVECAIVGNMAMLESATVEARAVVVVALTDDLTTSNDDATMAVVQRRLGGLLETERQIVVGLHFCC